jgi:hypothetical protein
VAWTGGWIGPRRSRASIDCWSQSPPSTRRRVSDCRRTSASTRRTDRFCLAAIHVKSRYLIDRRCQALRASLRKANRGRPGAEARRSISNAAGVAEMPVSPLLFRVGFMTDKFCYQSQSADRVATVHPNSQQIDSRILGIIPTG